MKLSHTLAAALVAVFLMNPNPTQPSSQPYRTTLAEWQPIIIRAKCCAYALKHDAEPAYVMAVAHIESRKGKREFRTWRTGKYYQPMGLQYGQYRRFARMGLLIDSLDGNIEVGAMSFAGIHTLSALKRRLRRYNCTFDNAYWNQVCKAIGKYRKGVSL